MVLQNKENTNIPLYEKQLRDAESGIQNMLNAIQAGILTSSTKERLEQFEEIKRELEARIAEEKLAKPKVTEEFIFPGKVILPYLRKKFLKFPLDFTAVK